MPVVSIDLANVRSKAELLAQVGEVLEFGGVGDIGQRPSPASDDGWGRNWDALSDSLCYLDTGGIWGTSRQLPFPLTLRFENSAGLRSADPESVRLLTEILGDLVAKYERNEMDFKFEFS
jgi:hypothetical protein